jgi:Domain of unknown function (DUF1844)
VGQDAQNSEFKVSDRRRFSSEGEPLDPAEEKQAASSDSGSSGQAAEPAENEARSEIPVSSEVDQAGPYDGPSLPEASFDLLIVSLGMQAQMELSQAPAPEAPPPNLDLARHTIDLLSVLQQKTKGNLTLEESRLLENTLTELRFRYVQRVEAINQRAKS